MTGRDRRNTKKAIAAKLEVQRQRPPASTPQPAPAPAPEQQQRPAPRPAPTSAPYVAPVKPSPADLEVQDLLTEFVTSPAAPDVLTQMSESDGDLTPIQVLTFELFRDLARDLVLHMTHPGSLDALIDRLPALGTAARLGTRNALLAAES